MGSTCIMVPKKGKNLFLELKKGLGYEDAKQVFLKGISPRFIEDHKDTLSLDAEGIPTKDSLLNTLYMKDLLGKNRIAKSIESLYRHLEDTDSNYNVLLNQAYSFNKDSQYKDEFVAIVEYKSNDNIGISVYPKTQLLLEKSRQLYAAFLLNSYLANEFANLGVTVGELSTAEQAAGRVGVTDFSKAAGIARDFNSIVRVSRNMEGQQALSEEWSHMIVRIQKNKNNPLISRAIEALSKNERALQDVLGDDFLDVMDFHEGNLEQVAEEALGHILKDALIQEELNKNVPNKPLINRVKSNILNQCKEHDPLNIERAIIEAEYSMKELAKSIISEGLNSTEKDVENTYSEEQFNALSDRIERGLDILKEARKVEVKRKELYSDKQVQLGNLTLDDGQALIDLRSHLVEDADVIGEGVLLYAGHAVKMLKSLLAGLQNVDRSDPNKLFPLLTKIKLYVDSYGKFIHAMNNMYLSELKEDDDIFIKNRTINGEEVNFKDIMKDLSYYSNTLMSQYVDVGIPAFAEVLKPFLGKKLTDKLKKEYGVDNVVQYLLERSPGDITVFDQWLDSMRDSSDVILLLFDAKVKEVKDQERLQTIDDIKVIHRLMMEAEKLGITFFEWMFEKDSDGNKTGEYISHINMGLFRKDQSEFFAYLAEKYGKNPIGQAAKDMLAERDAWVEEHCASKFMPNLPNLKKYENQEYNNLSASQKEILKKFLAIKTKYDKKLPGGRTYETKAIQRRKSGALRFLQSLSSPTSIYENIKESIKETFLDAEDDDSLFGTSKTTKGLKGFDGSEFMNLPVVYTSRLNNPNELSTDVFGDLCAYAHMANTYEAMSKVIDTLEVGKTLILKREVTLTRGGNKMVEKLLDLGTTITSFINKGGKTNQAAKVELYMRSQVYQRYMVDHGAIGKVNKAKTVNFLLKLGNLCTMAFNWLADSANIANAILMLNVEAFCGEYFSPGELLEADKEYSKAMTSFIPELAHRIKTNKLSLVDELLEIRQDFSNNTKRKLKRSLAERILGKNWGSMGQDAGNHWLMNRTAIAYMTRIKVKVPEKGVLTLWEALTVSDRFEDNSAIKQVGLPEGTTLEDGSPVNLAKIGREIAQINHGVLGIYNLDDANSANQVALGRALQQYRKWMKSILNKRFLPRRADVLMDTETEGFYITMLKLGRDLIRAKFLIGEVWDSLDDVGRTNVKRFVTEMAQLAILWALVNLVDWPDEEDRPWVVKFAQYIATRELKELSGVTPFGLRELGKNIKEPLPIYRQIDSAVALIYSIADPRDYYTVMESGPYKGLTVLEKNLLKAPIPVVSQWRQIERTTNGLEDAMQWYVKP